MPARDDFQFVEINDFSAGCVDQDGYASFAQSVEALGAADPAGTVGCHARPSGALGPGFKKVSSYSSSPPQFTKTTGEAVTINWDLSNYGSTYRPTDAPYRWLASTALLSPQADLIQQTDDYDWTEQIWIATHEYFDGDAGGDYRAVNTLMGVSRAYVGSGSWGTSSSVKFIRYNPTTDWGGTALSIQYPTWRSIRSDLVLGWNLTSYPTAADNRVRRALFWRACVQGTERSPYSGSATWSAVTGTDKSDWLTYYEPEGVATTPIINNNLPYSGYEGTPGSVFHQGRLVAATRVPQATTPALRFDPAVAFSSSAFSPSVQTVMFNPTPWVVDDGYSGTAQTYGILPIVGGQDFGITGMASMNANTLFVTQMIGGATMIRGDLARPQITYLPGVPPTGRYFSQPVTTPKGAAYAASTGIWLWNEGTAATHLSPRLSGRFWCTDGAAYEKAYFGTRRGKLASYGKWLHVPNNFYCDLDTGAWWKMATQADVDTPPYQNYEVSSNGQLYCIPAYQSTGSNNYLDLFDMETPEHQSGKTWTWLSHPLPDVLVTRSSVAREIDIITSGSGTIAVTLLTTDDTATANFTIADDYPAAIRANTSIHTANGSGGVSGTRVQITATGDGNGPLPTVYSLRIGFGSRESGNAT